MKFTVLAISKCTFQEHSICSHCWVTITTIQLQNFLIISTAPCSSWTPPSRFPLLGPTQIALLKTAGTLTWLSPRVKSVLPFLDP